MNNILNFDRSRITTTQTNQSFENNLIQFTAKESAVIEPGNFVKVVNVRSPKLEEFYHVSDVGVVMRVSARGNIYLVKIDKEEVWISKSELQKIGA